MRAFRHQPRVAWLWLAGAVWACVSALAPAASPAHAGGLPDAFALCGNGPEVACVIDGDTIVLQGVRIRMLDFDAPEIRKAECELERTLGEKARLRLVELLNGGVAVDSLRIVASGSREEDRYGRKLRLVTVNGRSVGDILIEEGLAWPWEGRRHDWCRSDRS